MFFTSARLDGPIINEHQRPIHKTICKGMLEGGLGAVLLSAFTPYTVHPLSGAIAVGIAHVTGTALLKLIDSSVEKRISLVVSLSLSILAGSFLATTLGCPMTFTACALSAVTGGVAVLMLRDIYNWSLT